MNEKYPGQGPGEAVTLPPTCPRSLQKWSDYRRNDAQDKRKRAGCPEALRPMWNLCEASATP